jgi:hypothetical protein
MCDKRVTSVTAALESPASPIQVDTNEPQSIVELSILTEPMEISRDEVPLRHVPQNLRWPL